jgi:hypothetical protein
MSEPLNFEQAFMLWRSYMLTALTGAQGYAQILLYQDKQLSASKRKEILNIVVKHQQDLLFCTQQLTLLLNLQFGQIKKEPKSIPLTKVVTEAQQHVSHSNPNITVDVIGEHPLLEVYCHPTISLMIANLLYPFEHYPKYENGQPIIHIKTIKGKDAQVTVTIGALTNVAVQEGILPLGVHSGGCLDIAHLLGKFDGIEIMANYTQTATIFTFQLPINK